jgi:hypothetical protein
VLHYEKIPDCLYFDDFVVLPESTVLYNRRGPCPYSLEANQYIRFPGDLSLGF